MRDRRHVDGDVAEAICAEYFIRKGYWVFTTAQGSSAVDLVAVNKDGARLIQVKKDHLRINPGRSKPARIHRVRSDLQKALGVEMVYVNVKTRKVFITDHDYSARRKRRV